MKLGTTLALSFLASPLAASTVPRVTLDDLAREAHVVLDGRVEEARSHVLPNGVIVTTYRLAVLEMFAGPEPRPASYEFTVVGGTVGDRTLKVPGLPRFAAGERHVLFLNRPSAIGTCIPLGLAQGAYEVQPVAPEGSDEPVVRRHLNDLTIVDPRTGREVAVANRSEKLSAFKARVRDAIRRTR